MEKVWCLVPSSSANLGPGFDCFSLALSKPYLRVGVEKLGGEQRVEIECYGKYAHKVIRESDKNAGGRALTELIRRKGINEGLKLTIHAEIPVAKGLGSSGAEAVGAVIATSHLFKLDLERREVVDIASTAEPGMHVDNVVASVMGGFNVTVRTNEGIDVLSLKPPDGLGLVVVIPGIEKGSTCAARRVLTNSVKLDTYVEGLARASIVAASVAAGRLDKLLSHVSFDPLVERVRAEAGVYGSGYCWKELLKEKERLLARYNVALTISGAGPARLLWYDKRRSAIDQAVGELVDGFKSRGYEVEEIIYTEPSATGACIEPIP